MPSYVTRAHAWRATLSTAVALAACALGSPPPAAAQRTSTDSSHAGHHMAMASRPNSPDLLDLSMRRMGSGTTWVPEVAPLPSHHLTAGAWSVMAHGFVFAQYDVQGGPRGDRQLGSLNWGMLMASRPLADGRFEARTMLSLDALTVSGRGYPLLLQTGESSLGAPIRDRQHPHDAWMELGALYERPLASGVAVSLYAAPSGEPALGPVAFMHRPSAVDNPLAPIGHHWQDATHVAFGVVTAGVFGRWWKLEGSAFNGREPDDQRWNFDLDALTSWSARATVNPNERWSLSAGYGFLRNPEIAHPDESVHRITASALRSGAIRDGGQWAAAAIWGADGVHGRWTHSALIEAEAVLGSGVTIFGRAERVEKSGEELVVPRAVLAADNRVSVAALSLGVIRETVTWRAATLGLGAMTTANVVPRTLAATYGSRTPLGGLIFTRLRVSGGSHGGNMDHMP
jgi:hypothetical protein